MEQGGGEPGGYWASCVPCGSQAAQSVLSIGSNDVFPPPRDAAGLLISQLIALPPLIIFIAGLWSPVFRKSLQLKLLT